MNGPWWFNRFGDTALVLSPTDGAPKYGLVSDVASSPHWTPQHFHTFYRDMGRRLDTIFGDGSPKPKSKPRPTFKPEEAQSSGFDWSDITGFAGDVAHAIGKGYYNLDQAIGSDKEYTNEGQEIHGYKQYSNEFKGQTGETARTVMEAPGVKQLGEALDTVDRYVAGGLEGFNRAIRKDSTDPFSSDFYIPDELFESSTWRGVTDPKNPSTGQELANLVLYGGHATQDELAYKRKHDVAFNLVSGSFDVIYNWKAAPEVLAAKGVGTGVRWRRGSIPVNWYGKSARGTFRNATLDRLQGRQVRSGISPSAALGRAYGDRLATRMDRLRDAAQLVKNGQMPFDKFANQYAYRTATNGPALAMAHVLASGDDDLWKLTQRASFGDASAYDDITSLATDASAGGRFQELADRFPDAQSWVDALRANGNYIKGLDEDIAATQKAVTERLQSGNVSGYFRYNTWLMETDLAAKQARLAEVQDQLANYQDYDGWLQKVTDSMGGQPMSSVSAHTAKLGSEKFYSAFHDGKLARAFRFDSGTPYGKAHTVVRIARAPWLKKPGILDLHNSTEGFNGMRSYYDQLQGITGWSDPTNRALNLEKFARLNTDTERRAFLENFELNEVANAFGQKYDVDPDVVSRVLSNVMTKRNVVVDDMAANAQGGLFHSLDEDGNVLSMELPVDASELKNYYMTIDLQKLDMAMRHDTQFMREASSGLSRGYHNVMSEVDDWMDLAGSKFNSVWKPLVLLRVGWATRVVPDEGMRTAAQVAAMPFLQNIGKSIGASSLNTLKRGPRKFINGKSYDIGPGPLTRDTWDVRIVGSDMDVPSPFGGEPKPIDRLINEHIPGRQETIQRNVSERNPYHQQVDYHRAMTREFDEGRVSEAPEPVPTPVWAARYNKLLAYAKDHGGATFDPVTDAAHANGWAVKSFPDASLTIPENRMGPQWLNYFADKHSNLLAQRGSRISVSYDNGQYRLDVVRHFSRKRLEQALEYAAATEADGVVDIGNRFNEFSREVPVTDGVLPQMAQAPDAALFNPRRDAQRLQLHFEQNKAMPATPDRGVRDWFLRRTHLESKPHTWRDRDGKTVQYDGMYDEEGRVFMALNSGAPVWKNLFGQGKTAEGMRRIAGSYEKLDPPPLTGGTLHDWLTMPSSQRVWRDRYYNGWLTVVNDHMRYSPIWRKMLAGQSDDEIIHWFYNTQQGRNLIKRMPWMGAPEKRVTLHRYLLDELLPSEHLQARAAQQDLTLQDLIEGIHPDHRPSINVNELEAVQGGPISRAWGKFVKNAYTAIGTLPTDALVRHPFAATMYNMKMRNFLAQNAAVSEGAMRAAQREARNFALGQIKRTLFNLADDSNFMHFYRFVLPFANATFETITRWARISVDHPEAIVHMAQAWDSLNHMGNLSQATGGILPSVQIIPGGEFDPKGKVYRLGRYEYGPSDTVVVSVPDWLREGFKKVGFHGLDYVDKVAFDKGNLNMVFQGDNPHAWQSFVPSTSPMVNLPADWMLKLRKDDGLTLKGNPIYDWMFPIGRPEPGVHGAVETLLPAWLRRVDSYMRKDGDNDWQHLFFQIADAANMDYRRGLTPKPTIQEIRERTDAQFALRIFNSFALPVQLQYKTPYQFYIDKSHELNQKYGPIEGEARFTKQYGTDYYRFAQSLSNSVVSIPATQGGLKQSLKFKDLISQYPDYAGMIVAPQAFKEPFDYDVYKHQFTQHYSNGSPRTIRETQSYQERVNNADEEKGWSMYLAWASGIDAELKRRGLTSLNSSGAEDLAHANNQFKDNLSHELPAWGRAYTADNASVGSRINQLREIAFDPRMKHRPDMAGLRHYLEMRGAVAQYLNQQYASGGSRNLQASENSQIKGAWDAYVGELKDKNPMFADLYNRYLSGDTMETGGGI